MYIPDHHLAPILHLYDLHPSDDHLRFFIMGSPYRYSHHDPASDDSSITIQYRHQVVPLAKHTRTDVPSLIRPVPQSVRMSRQSHQRIVQGSILWRSL